MTRKNQQRGGVSGRLHEENIPAHLMDEIRSILAFRFENAESAEAGAIRLQQLYDEAGISSQKPYPRTLTGDEWRVITRSCLESLDTALLLNSIGGH